MKMKVHEVMEYLEGIVGSLEEISSKQELGRLLQKKFHFAFIMDDESEISFLPQEEAEKK